MEESNPSILISSQSSSPIFSPSPSPSSPSISTSSHSSSPLTSMSPLDKDIEILYNNENKIDILSLSNTILIKILRNVVSDFDRICFVLSSKQLFIKSSKILFFTRNNLHPKEFYILKSKFRLNSFKTNLFDTLSFGKCNSNKIPENCTHLTIHSSCTEVIKPGLIPKTVKYLHWNVNQIPGRGVIPCGLKRLHFGNEYNQPTTSLPKNITYLEFGNTFNQLSVLPKSLLHLRYAIGEQEPVCNPTGTTHLHYDRPTLDIKQIVKSVISIDFGKKFNEPITKNQLSQTITHLAFGFSYQHKFEVGVLPLSLKSLIFGFNYNQMIEKDVLPRGLKHLNLGQSYSLPIGEGVLPEGLESVDFGKIFDHPIVSILPSTVKNISLPDNYIHPLPKTLEMVSSGYKILNQLFDPNNNNQQQSSPLVKRIFINTFRLHEIEIRILDNKNALFLTRSLEGGIIKTESLKDGTFLKTLN
ncbi:hypothetical protein PPL_01954 [Heterostelium album PN500]|uniref:FNIP repeat-containing protein n=1 Tax=Heterostelium pallidum (strain ATCC 26659 / Pp 5 / PN500) TaxID=670386 RepID=D3B0Y7_HETP5|nr:hypothetical protein PPL_01954 [Heterostelium album PN500]EFA84961.1 hypothetical protein PPL_01954 [Heterostelium album PN500]|eukprot:XP_020437071.1 hypothetical protein PPL_01954 [Heterostelium album PN500]